MSDRLEEIKGTEYGDPDRPDIDWLIGEVERLRSDNALLAGGLVDLRERTEERERILRILQSEVADVRLLYGSSQRHEAKLDADGGQVVTPEK